MQSFPILKNDEVALMRANSLKGYVLDESFEVATNNDQVVYTVISVFDDAMRLANQIITAHIDVECVIYNKDQKVLSFLSPHANG